jgi:transcriptional regulator with GAF, ATPase, and Fis domain
VAINCSAIPESLAESQLFGHLRGAFTGASPQLGLFRAAEGGTLFLDEIGELSAAIQPKLLRALEEQAVLPVGATKPVPVNVRIVAATNRSLDEEVCQRQFRGDLLARLAGVRLALPPLRDRREDILLLLERALIHGGATQFVLQPDLVERLLLYSWPYNVRELFKVAWELQIRGKGLPLLDLSLVSQRLPLSVLQSSRVHSAASTEVVAAVPSLSHQSSEPDCTLRRGPVPSKTDLQNLLVKHKGIVADIAKEVERSRMQVYRWLTQRGLDVDSYRR